MGRLSVPDSFRIKCDLPTRRELPLPLRFTIVEKLIEYLHSTQNFYLSVRNCVINFKKMKIGFFY